MQTPPARIGNTIEQVDTPALIVDLDAFDANIARMADFGSEAGIRLRPHAKTHRCPAVALRQVAAGAVGQCVQTIGEAEAMVAGGIADVMVTNQIVSPLKLARLTALAERARVSLLVDSPEGVALASQAAAERGVELGCLVEIEVGMGRCGIAPGAPAAELGRRIADAPSLKFLGLQAYNGRSQHFVKLADRRAAVERAADAVRETVQALTAHGLTAEIIGGAGTGTFRLEAAAGLWTELQVGSYVFMDREYASLEGEGGRVEPEFRQSLFVLATIVSHSAPDRAVANGGLKVMSAEQGKPGLTDMPGAEVVGISDEHSLIRLGQGAPAVAIGQPVRLVPSHCDPTVNLHDWIVAVRGDRVEEIWPVTARGASR
jgi:D-serine deaminase-like pyridoxal phosphate-dependent protein